MRITVKSIFEPEELEIEIEATTLGAYIDKLSEENRARGIEFWDITEGNKVSTLYSVFLNGQISRDLAEGLDTNLHDGDKVEIYLTAVIGG